jgi:hypothetical protein
MDPGIAEFDALFADISISGFKFDLLHVTATLGHGNLLKWALAPGNQAAPAAGFSIRSSDARSHFARFAPAS